MILLNLTIACGKGFEEKKKANGTKQADPITRDGFILNQEYLSMVNDYRHKLGLKSLTYNSDIEDVALSHSRIMAKKNRPFGHVGFSQRCRRISDRLGNQKRCGEIVAMGQKTPKAVFKAWLSSAAHKGELEHPLMTHTGLGFFEDENGVIYWTQIFIEL